MAWDRHVFSEKKSALIQLAAIFLILLSLYMDSKLIFFIGVVAFIAVTLNQLYASKVGEGLIVVSERKRDRFFISEKGMWVLDFKNSGWPVLNSEIRLLIDNNVLPAGVSNVGHSPLIEMRIPLSIMRGEAKRMEIPFLAQKRGLAKIRKLELYIPSIFGFGHIILDYRQRLEQEALVYPARENVHNKKIALSGRQGTHFTPNSLYEDLLAPSGTRDYVNSDGFKRIHWKASARSGRLQTKVYDRIAEQGILLSLNVSSGYSISSSFEVLLESAADIAHFAHSNHIPFSVCLNTRLASEVPFSYVPPGQGREHLQKVYDVLAVASPNHVVFPYDKMVSYIGNHLHLLPCIIHMGALEGTSVSWMDDIAGRGIQVLSLSITDSHVELIPYRVPMQARGNGL